MSPAHQAARVVYDASVGGIRIAKAEICGHVATFTCNELLRHCTVQISGTGPLAPDIVCKDGKFAMVYQYAAVTDEVQAEFEASYEKAKAFCRNAGPAVARIRAMIEDGLPLDGPGPA